jgi:hypothetical protein
MVRANTEQVLKNFHVTDEAVIKYQKHKTVTSKNFIDGLVWENKIYHD